MSNLADGYREICIGKSEGKFLSKPIFFHHATMFDQFKVSKEKEKEKNWAMGHNLPTKEEAIARAIKSGFWSQEQESNLKMIREDYKNYCQKRGKGKTMTFDSIRKWHEVERMMKSEIESLMAQRHAVLEQNQESYSVNKSFDYEIFLLSKTVDNSSFFREDEFEDLSPVEIDILRGEYYGSILKFDEYFFKKLAVTPFFYSLFDNCATHPSDFFRKPICDLTFFQTQMLEYGKRFNELLKYCYGAPDDFFEDPELLVTLSMFRQNGVDGEGRNNDSLQDMNMDIAKNKAAKAF